MMAARTNKAGAGDIATDLIWVAGYAVAASVAAVAVFRRRMHE